MIIMEMILIHRKLIAPLANSDLHLFVNSFQNPLVSVYVSAFFLDLLGTSCNILLVPSLIKKINKLFDTIYVILV